MAKVDFPQPHGLSATSWFHYNIYGISCHHAHGINDIQMSSIFFMEPSIIVEDY